MLVFQVLDHLREWTRPITDLYRFVHTSVHSSKKKSKAIAGPKPHTDIVLPEDASPIAISAHNDIQSVWRALKLTTTSKLLRILIHAELLGLSVSWFSKVRIPFLCPKPAS
jgi:hypothetical protein